MVYVFIPLNMILRFAEDYRKIVVNMKYELVLSRLRTDKLQKKSESESYTEKTEKKTIPVIPNRTPKKIKRLGKPWFTPERGTFTDYSMVLVKDKEMENSIMRKPTRPLM